MRVEIDGQYGRLADGQNLEGVEGAIYIFDEDDDDREVIMWDSTEWIEDPSLVFVIANAIRLALTDRSGFLRRVNEGFITPDR